MVDDKTALILEKYARRMKKSLHPPRGPRFEPRTGKYIQHNI